MTAEILTRESTGSVTRYVGSFTVTAGSSIDVLAVGGYPTVLAKPGSGGTATVSATNSPAAAVDAGTAEYVAWDLGAVSVATLRGWAPGTDVSGLRLAAATADAEFIVSTR